MLTVEPKQPDIAADIQGSLSLRLFCHVVAPFPITLRVVLWGSYRETLGHQFTSTYPNYFGARQ